MSLLFDYMCMRLLFNLWSIAGVPSTQALPGFLITAPPSACVPEVIGALAVWIPNLKKTVAAKKITHMVMGVKVCCKYVCVQWWLHMVRRQSSGNYTCHIMSFNLHCYVV